MQLLLETVQSKVADRVTENGNQQRVKKIPGIKKYDISLPMGFSHVAHSGPSAPLKISELDFCFTFLRKAGVPEKHLNNRRTRDFVTDFIATMKEEEGLDSLMDRSPNVINSFFCGCYSSIYGDYKYFRGRM